MFISENKLWCDQYHQLKWINKDTPFYITASIVKIMQDYWKHKIRFTTMNFNEGIMRIDM